MLDDVLHFVPLDALPADGPWAGAGEGLFRSAKWSESRCGRRSSSCWRAAAAERPRRLVALGHPAFDGEPSRLERRARERRGSSPGRRARAPPPRSGSSAGARGSAASRRCPRRAPRCARSASTSRRCSASERAPVVLESARPPAREARRARAQARVPPRRDARVVRAGVGALVGRTLLLPRRSRRSRRVALEPPSACAAMSPLLLCGLALAGANLPENAARPHPGTRDGGGALDARSLELRARGALRVRHERRRAPRGPRRREPAEGAADGGRAQRDHVAVEGARRSDEGADARLLPAPVGREEAQGQALWEAKTKLRAAKDERGRRSTRRAIGPRGC